MKHKIDITNPDKVLYPGGRFTKAEVVQYYRRIAPVLLPHFRNRPVTLKRYPEGVHGEFFYEKDAPSFTPDWVKTFPVPRHDPGPPINYILVNNLDTLLWCANAAALELHPFLHRVPRIDTPTTVVFDLDPGEGANILNCIEVAMLVRDLFAQLRLKCFPKVSGSKGIQLYVPLNSAVTYEATQPFARAVAELMERQHSKTVVAEMAKNLRAGKVFIDWSQNAEHKTTIGVYSLRAKRNRPFVSLPLTWDELESALKKSSAESLYFTVDQALPRIEKVGDLFAPVLKLRQDVPKQFLERAGLVGSGAGTITRPKSLAEYERKRHFARTMEPAPTPRRSRQGSRRRFVVQQHAASHLHFDLRLEINDVLKSWAVPRGLPLQAGETHSAFETEDHPLEYLNFEGIIPQREYGGGTVMVWDIGTFEIVEGNYWKGALTIFLNGKKLKGAWTINRAESENAKTKWLVTKVHNGNKRLSIKRANVSALSGRTMEQIARASSAVWHSNRYRSERAVPASRGNDSSTKSKSAKGRRQRTAHVAPPEFTAPMKATSVDKLPDGDEWLYEIKWDGYRGLALKNGDSVRLLSLKEKSLGSDFPQVIEAVGGINARTATLDGEIVAVNASGKPSFQILQNRKSLGRGWQIVYYAFDLLYENGQDLRRKPLVERKEMLRKVIEGSAVRYSAELEGSAAAVVSTVKNADLEGVVAKRRNSAYQSATRSSDWLKLKVGHLQEFVIGGYNPDAASFQSLLAGYYEGKRLMFAGKVRQGFNPAMRKEVFEKLRLIQVPACPFANLPTSKKSHFGEGVTAEDMKKLKWVKPKLVVQVQFSEWTSYGLLRHATYLGLRDDKKPREVTKIA